MVSVVGLPAASVTTTVTSVSGSVVPLIVTVLESDAKSWGGVSTVSVGAPESSSMSTSSGAPALPKSSEATARIVRGPSAG